MKHTIIIFLSLFVSAISAQENLNTVKVAEKISLKIPESLVSMTEKDRISSYVSTKVPIATYTSQDRAVDFSINSNRMEWVMGDEEILRGFYKSSFKTLFDEIDFIQDTIRKINGKKFIVFEFVSTLKEDNAVSGMKVARHYSYIQYTSYEGSILLFNFGCKPRNMQQWQPIAREMMESVRIKE